MDWLEVQLEVDSLHPLKLNHSLLAVFESNLLEYFFEATLFGTTYIEVTANQ
jgi:hypothetical protein